jgi:hypothetical protein
MKRASMKSATVIAPLVIAIIASFAASAARAQDAQQQPVNANDSACFPMCQGSTPAIEAEVDVKAPTANACANQSNDLIKQAEQLNDRVKPIKEIVGYVRSPQGLAIKLVNDHVVKIPAWVGYAMDPVGSLKNRAMDEVRGVVTARAKAMVGLDRATTGCPAETAAPIDAALIPVDTQQI